MTTYIGAPDADDPVAALFEKHRGPLLAYLTRLVGNWTDAEDLCQETFVKVVRHWDEHGPHSSVTGWLYRIATTTAYDYIRREQRKLYAPLWSAEHFSGASERIDWWAEVGEPVQEILIQMSYPERTSLLLHACAGFSIADIAKMFDCSSDAAKMRLYRARMRFRQLYLARPDVIRDG